MIEIHAQAERLKRMIGDEVNRIALAARTDYESAKTNEDLLTRNVDALKQSTLATNAAMVTLRELERDVQASRAVYEAFLVRARETGEQERLDTKNIQVISKADLPMNRSSPPPSSLIALGALLLGVAAGAGLVMMRASMPRPTAPRPGAASARQDRGNWRDGETAAAELAAGVPVLAVMPHGEGFAPEAVQNPRSRVAVAIQQVYDAVQASPVRPGNRSVMVVASGDDADAAAVALTLAALVATTQRVLLIDADLERRALSAIDADHSEAGLVDVAVGRRLLSETVLRDRDTNLNVIPFVSPNSRRDRRITDEDIRLAFAQTSNFDMVIVAATDVSRDPSARFFAGLVDHIVLVSQADAADESTVAAVLSALGINARKVRGAVLTEAAAA